VKHALKSAFRVHFPAHRFGFKKNHTNKIKKFPLAKPNTVLQTPSRDTHPTLVLITATGQPSCGHLGSARGALRAWAEGKGTCCIRAVRVGQASASTGETAPQEMPSKNLQAAEAASHLLQGVPITDCPKQQIKKEGEQYPRRWLTKVNAEG